jgi:adenosylcobinamide-GDP ribazoletransferase
MWKEFRNLLAFLTILPFRMDMNCLADSARFMFVFPLVGALIGLIAGLFGWAINFILPSLIVGALTFAFILLLTGLHHTDGLLDFGDAIMYHGTAERKIEIMHDQLTGAGALGFGLMTYIISALAVGMLNQSVFIVGVKVSLILPALIIIELAAKLSMVVATWAGKAIHEGMNSPFMEAMHGNKGNVRLIVALTFSLLISVFLLWTTGLVTIFAAVISGLSMVAIAHKHFGGVTGDVLGATNEIARMICLIVLLAMLQ